MQGRKQTDSIKSLIKFTKIDEDMLVQSFITWAFLDLAGLICHLGVPFS